MRIIFIIVLLFSLFFSIYDFLLGNIFQEPLHPSIIYILTFIIGVLFFLTIPPKIKPTKSKPSKPYKKPQK